MKYRDDLLQGVDLPQDFLDAIMETLGSYVSANFRVEMLTSTSLRVPANTDNDQVVIAINGKWRYITADADCAAPGGLAVGPNPIFVAASDNDFGVNPSPPPDELDSTDYSFRLIILPDGDTPTGSGDEALYRQVGTVVWNGTSFTDIVLAWDVEPVESAWRQAFDVSSASGLQTIFSQSIPPLGPDDEIEIVANARYTNSTSTPRALRIQISYGGVVFFDAITDTFGATAHAREWLLLAWLANEGDTDHQRLTGRTSMSNAATGTVGNGDLQVDDVFNHTLGGHDTVDTTSARTLVVKVALGASSADLEVIGTVRAKILRVP